MALFRITVTRRKNTAGMLIEPGMSVQIASFVNNPVTNIQECKKGVSRKTQLHPLSPHAHNFISL